MTCDEGEFSERLWFLFWLIKAYYNLSIPYVKWLELEAF
jgi:hypothetical protein